MDETPSAPAQAGVLTDQDLVEAVILRIATDLSMVLDREFSVGAIEIERVEKRVAGAGQIHISFKLGFRHGDELRHGCLLLPLPEAIGLANFLMLVPDEEVQSNRDATELDRTTKDALLEVGNFIGNSVDAIVRSLFPSDCAASFEGCQGVRADVRPAFPYGEGTVLVAARAEARLHDFPPFELVLMVPVLPGTA